MEELATVLAAVFGSEVRADAAGTHTIVRSGDAFFTARIRTSPVAELFVTTRALDGFELKLRCEGYEKGAPFERAFTMDTNDHALAQMWLDGVTRQSMIASVYGYKSNELSVGDAVSGLAGVLGGLVGAVIAESIRPEPGTAWRTWTYELATDQLWVTKGGVEHHPERIVVALQTAAAIAARSHRWAAEYAAMAGALDATVRSEVELGLDRPPLITATRHAVEVGMRMFRRLPDRSERLRTQVSAARINHDGSTFSLVDDELPRAARPPVPRGSKVTSTVPGYTLREAHGSAPIDDAAGKLIAIARPAAVVADLDSVDVWFDGAVMERDRLDAAFELTALWAVRRDLTQGPYR
jgi:hypothetical protein